MDTFQAQLARQLSQALTAAGLPNESSEVTPASDPRFGDTTYTLTNIQRQEPGAAFFAIPTDYTVEEGKPGMQMRGFDRVAPPAPPGAPPLGE